MRLGKRQTANLAIISILTGLSLGLLFGMLLGSVVGILVAVGSVGGIFCWLMIARKSKIEKKKERLSKNATIIMDMPAYFEVSGIRKVDGWLFLTKENLIFDPLVYESRYTDGLGRKYNRRRFSGDLAYESHETYSFKRQRIPLGRIQAVEQYKNRRLKLTASDEVLEFGVCYVPRWIEAIVAQQKILEWFGR